MYIHESMLNNDKPKIGSANIFTILDVAMMNLACDNEGKKRSAFSLFSRRFL